MALDLSMIHSAVRIIGETRKGTGFLITVDSETLPDVRYGYAVTAHHIIEGQTKIRVQIPDPFKDGELYEPFQVKDWRRPLDKVDLALAPIPDRDDRTYQALRLERNLIPADPPSPWINLGSDIYYIGILSPLDRPMVRSGTIGALDQTGIRHKGGYDYPAHLVDCRSYDGFSGSPCFLDAMFAGLEPTVLPPHNPPPEQLPPMGAMYHVAMLCGMFTEHLEDNGKQTGAVSRYGVGVMLRANEIREALMTEEMQKHRAGKDARAVAKKESGPELENTSDESADEFERFEDLTRKLINTPKPEKPKESGG